MKRCLFALAICSSCYGLAIAGKPLELSTRPPKPKAAAAKPAEGPRAASLSGRRNIEARLSAPAGLDFGERERVTAREVLHELHERHRLSIRFDAPTFAAMFGDPTSTFN